MKNRNRIPCFLAAGLEENTGRLSQEMNVRCIKWKKLSYPGSLPSYYVGDALNLFEIFQIMVYYI